MRAPGVRYQVGVRGFLAGAIVGAMVGAGGVYAALEKPWQAGAAEVAEPDAGAQAEEPTRKKQRRRRKGRRHERRHELVGDVIPELSARDRELVWRGPAVSLPERDMDFGAGGGGRPLDQGEIDRGISSRRDRVIDCIASARGNAELRASITLKFLVGEDGSVGPVRLRAPRYLFDQGLQSCATRAVRGMRFPGTGAATVVTLPLDLS